MFEHLTRNGPYSEATAAGFMRELAAALCFLHSNEIIHADLKPENLMLSSWNLGESKLKVGCTISILLFGFRFCDMSGRDCAGEYSQYSGLSIYWRRSAMHDEGRKAI